MTKTIWIDILTPKQAMLLGTIALRLMNKDINIITTTRSYDYTQAVLNNLGITYIAIGRYGDTLLAKLIEEIDRMKKIIEIIGDKFDLAISYPNPVVARITFGLGKPYIALTDSPHSKIVSRLSLPLAKHIVISKCIPIEAIKPYVYYNETKITQYNGVDEVEWLKDVKPDENYVRSIGLEPFNYIIVRPPEVKASYYRYSNVIELFNHIIKKILDLDAKLIYMPRYPDDPFINYLHNHKNVIIPKLDSGIIGYHVIYYALAVITGGGTLAREAALLGTLGISLFPEELYVDKCLQNLGLPLLKCKDVYEFIDLLNKYIQEPEKSKEYALTILKELEKPSEILIKIIREETSWNTL